MTEQITLTWYHLPKLPPEPRDEVGATDYLIACTHIRGNEYINLVYKGWYEGNGHWVDDSGYNLYGIYAWTQRPEAPPVKEA